MSLRGKSKLSIPSVRFTGVVVSVKSAEPITKKNSLNVRNTEKIIPYVYILIIPHCHKRFVPFWKKTFKSEVKTRINIIPFTERITEPKGTRAAMMVINRMSPHSASP